MAPIVLLLGPTAIGKTECAMGLQDYFGGAEHAQIISVDSAMVYRQMDIGTAKPSPAELASYPHALIDLRDPKDAYSAADFVHDADAAVRAARTRGQVPILVGGTMLYARAFLTGLADLPSADEETRAALKAEYQRRGGEELHAELTRIDPEAAANIDPNNEQRLLRALEVIRITARPISELWREQRGETVVERLGGEVMTLSLEPDDRSWLYRNIEQRFAAMLAAGFLDEVQALRERGDLHLDLPSMRAVGYRQAWQYAEGELSHEQFRQDALTATRRLAKRQLTWLRQWPRLVRITRTPTDSGLAEMTDYLDGQFRSV
ncbi:MAG: tRNA (adenosine(37)-N6)-dimethylallyltransferase MiaA [Pseudomonadales bacterium]